MSNLGKMQGAVNLSNVIIEHCVEKGQHIYQIAKMYNTKTWKILTANPLINPFDLKENSTIYVPTMDEIVSTVKPMDYTQLQDTIFNMLKCYPFLKCQTIGKSVDGRLIQALTFGKGSHVVLYNGSHHGNEWISSLLLMKWLESICEAYALNGRIKGYSIKQLFLHSSICIVPMVNPDGVELVINGYNDEDVDIYSMNNFSDSLDNWKANARGVDLNRNYDAGWSTYKQLERKLNINGPGPSGYSGIRPFSEPESAALAAFTMDLKPELTLSFHSQGRVIYYQFFNETPAVSLQIAMELSRVSGYALENEEASSAYAGYKDWFIHQFGKPGFTIELGSGKNPLPIEQIQQVYEETEELMLLAAII